MRIRFRSIHCLIICMISLSFFSTANASQQIPTSKITQVVLSPTPHLIVHQLKNISQIDSVVTSGKYAWLIDKSTRKIAFFNGYEWSPGQRPKGTGYYLIPVYSENSKNGDAWLYNISWKDEIQLIKMENGVLTEPFLVKKLLGLKDESEALNASFVISGGYVFLISGIIHAEKAGENNSFLLTIYNPNTKKWSDVKKIYLTSNAYGDISAIPAGQNEPGLFIRFDDDKHNYAIHYITIDGVLKPNLYQGEWELGQDNLYNLDNLYVTPSKSYLLSKHYIYNFDSHPQLTWRKITPTLVDSVLTNNEFDVPYYEQKNGMFCGLVGSYLARNHQIKCVDTTGDNYWPMYVIHLAFQQVEPMTQKGLTYFMGENNIWMLMYSDCESDMCQHLSDVKMYDYDFRTKKTIDTQLEGSLQGNVNKLFVKIIPDNKILLCSTGSSQVPVAPTVLYYNRNSQKPSWTRVSGESLPLEACGFSDEDYDGESYGIHNDAQMRGDTLWLFNRPPQ